MNRRHDIDALRVFAFALLILYHTAMAYVDDWGFHLKSSYTSEWLQWPMLFVNRWRMALLFLLSGIAIALMGPGQQIGRFVAKRSWRLLLPLLFGMFVVVPVQPYCEAVASGHAAPGFWAFLLRYWQVSPWPQDSFTGWQFGITWNHLWYLAYLWVYTVLLALLMPLLGSATVRSAMQRFACAPALVLVGVPSVVLFIWVAWLDPRYPSTGALFDDWYQHAKYGSVFLAGYLLARQASFWDRVVALRWTTLWMALVAISWYFGIRVLGRMLAEDSALRQWPDAFWTAQVMASQSLYLWAMLLTLLGWAKTWLDRPFRWLPYCTEAIFPWYMLHQSLIIVLLFWLKPLQLGPWWEPLLVLAGTVAGCLLLHELLIRRIPVLRPLFGMPARGRSSRTSPIAIAQEGARG
ncbi:acyltransferase family protein [Stenotrophomonas tumulicola]|uniref:Acyltransferase family protein n=1 Tax=Stenotrophomonas tumulicola TaxID=1685415 RepID=A0A7W3FQ00_9GAMM|nr:acyltransferase family protein [Stenotrophomonas tumulicola]MBA8683619.1 acyltransferase family protein [Stenotrophomonas tumulicola]